MTISQRFKTGFDIVLKSFDLLWNNKKAVIYLHIIYFLAFLIPLALFFVTKFNMTLFASLTIFIIIYTEIVFMYLTGEFANGRKPTVRQAIKHCSKKITKIVTLSALFVLAFKIFVYLVPTKAPVLLTETEGNYAIPAFKTLALENISLALWAFIIVGIMVGIAFVFALPAIALENKSLVQIIKDSPRTFMKLFFEFTGAMGTIAGASILLSLVKTATAALYLLLGPLFLIIFIPAAILLFIIGAAIKLAGTMTLALLYQEYKAKKIYQ